MGEYFAHFEEKNEKMLGKIQNFPEIFSRFFPVWFRPEGLFQAPNPLMQEEKSIGHIMHEKISWEISQ